MIPTRLRLVIAVDFDALNLDGAPKLVGRAIEAAMAGLCDRGEIGTGPVIIGLLNARRQRPRREPSASQREG